MALVFRIFNATIRSLTRVICMVDDADLIKVPLSGPLLLVSNHVNFLDIPLLVSHLQPRPLTGLIKEETWDNPLMAVLFTLWQGIPIRRGEYDARAFSLAMSALQEGKILALSPEGTRSGNGILAKGHSGVSILAQRSRAPILPVAIHGGESVWDNLRRMTRTEVFIRVGTPFFLNPHVALHDRLLRESVTDQIMYQIAALLPPRYRGPYGELDLMHFDYFHAQPGMQPG